MNSPDAHMTKRLFTSLKTFLPFIGISIFVYLIYSLGPHDIYEALISIPPTIIILACLLTIPRVLIRNVAWMMLHNQQKIHVSFWRSLKIFLMGYFYGSFTPGYVGQLMRIPYLKEQTGEPYGKLFVNSFIETTLHLLSMYGLMFIGSVLILQQLPEAFYLISIWIAIVIVFLFIFISKKRGETVLRFFGKNIMFRILFFLPNHWKKNMSLFAGSFYHDFPKLSTLIPPLIVGSFTWIIIFSQEYLIARALQVDVPYLFFLVLVPIANMAGIIPISVAGLGTRELTSIVLFTTLFGIAETTVFVFTLVGFVITDVLTGLVGFLLTLTEAKPAKSILDNSR